MSIRQEICERAIEKEPQMLRVDHTILFCWDEISNVPVGIDFTRLLHGKSIFIPPRRDRLPPGVYLQKTIDFR